MNAKLTDEETIRRYLVRQPGQCFETLYSRYAHKVYYRCLSMTKDVQQAQDFTQDIFLKVFNKLKAFQQRSTFSTWLYAITYNHCLNQLQIAKRLRVSSLETVIGYDIAETGEDYLRVEKLQVMDQAIDKLSQEERSLLELKYGKGISIEEIAQLYSLKTSAVKMRLKRSREKVHRLYDEQAIRTKLFENQSI